VKPKLLLIGALGAAALSAVPAVAATTRSVRVTDNVFSPRSLTANRGDTIRFRWTGKAPHNVVRTSGPAFTRIATRKRGTVSRRVSRRGTYRLTCTIHPGMNLVLRVR
jgi:plastocyanin